MIIVSAPTKVHLMGEHAVVHGKPAIIAAIEKRITAKVTKGNRNIDTEEIVTPYIAYIKEIIQTRYSDVSLSALDISIQSDVPIGYHLGTSAAIAVATIGALVYATKKLWNPTLINQLAYEAEKYVHGNPSGGDNTAVTFGGLIWYRKELEFLRSMWQLPITIPAQLSNFSLINTGKPGNTTKETVEYVKLRVKSEEVKMKSLFDTNEIQTKRIAVALKENDELALMDAIQIGENTLEEMGVVSDEVKPLIRKIEDSGGTAKILGGGSLTGNVGFVLAYHKDTEKLSSIVSPFGYIIDPVTLGADGVRLENKQL